MKVAILVVLHLEFLLVKSFALYLREGKSLTDDVNVAKVSLIHVQLEVGFYVLSIAELEHQFVGCGASGFGVGVLGFGSDVSRAHYSQNYCVVVIGISLIFPLSVLDVPPKT
jgi:hypothetical protein